MHPGQLLPRHYLPAELRSKTLLHLAVVLATVVIGTIVFSVVDQEAPGDSLYFIVMVMTLVGAQNPHTFAGEIVGIVVAIVSVGVLVSFMTQILGPAALAQYWEGLRVRKARRMKDHIILCGDSDTARALLERLPKDRLVVVAKDKARAESLTGSGFAVVAGDYETADSLRRAGVEASRAVIAASEEDSENAFVCLTAKALAPNVPVLATASSEENLNKLRAVRANHIVSPALLSAAEILRALAPGDATGPR